MTAPDLTLTGIVLGAPDPQSLASFYERLLGYDRTTDSPEWVVTVPPGGGPGLSFQQMQVHLDIAVDDLERAGAHAREAGATLAAFQPQDDVRVWIDPVGHPFCLYVKG